MHAIQSNSFFENEIFEMFTLENSDFNFSPKVFRFFGYFPITTDFTASNFKKLNLNNVPTKNNLVPPRFHFSTILILLPPLLNTITAVVLIIMFVINFEDLASNRVKIRNRDNETGTFYTAITLKPFTHLFTSVFVKISMFLKRGYISELCDNIHTLHSTLLSSKFPQDGSSRKLYEQNRIRNVEVVVFLLIVICGVIELIHSMVNDCNTPIDIFLVVTPSMLGYTHSIFGLLIKYFLDWFLILLHQLKTILQSSKWSDVSLQEVCGAYLNLQVEVTRFCRLFGFWITIDLGHSLLRIIFSIYFAVSVFHYSKFSSSTVSGVLHDIGTVILYIYLIAGICQKGSSVWNESEEIIRLCEGSTSAQVVLQINLPTLASVESLVTCSVIFLYIDDKQEELSSFSSESEKD